MPAHHKRKRSELDRVKIRVLKYWPLVENGDITRKEFMRRFEINPQTLEKILANR